MRFGELGASWMPHACATFVVMEEMLKRSTQLVLLVGQETLMTSTIGIHFVPAQHSYQFK